MSSTNVNVVYIPNTCNMCSLASYSYSQLYVHAVSGYVIWLTRWHLYIIKLIAYEKKVTL